MKFCNNCAVPESQKCDAVSCPPACNGAEDACLCFNAGCFKAVCESCIGCANKSCSCPKGDCSCPNR